MRSGKSGAEYSEGEAGLRALRGGLLVSWRDRAGLNLEISLAANGSTV